MPQKKWTEEQKKAASERMKAMLAAKKAEKEAALVPEEVPHEQLPGERLPGAGQEPLPEPTNAPRETAVTNAPEQNTEELLRHALEAISNLTAQLGNQGQPAGPTLQNGKLLGTVEKYSTDLSRYPDPRERLANEQRLQRFGFQENYDLEWKVTTVEYTTINNIRMKEPRFQLDLINVIHDETTGERTGGRFLEYRLVFHEDPDSALWVARNNGIAVDDFTELDFLNEMRYIQMRDWLVGRFYKPQLEKQAIHKEMVVNGKLVDYFEVSDENPTTIPFDQLNTRA